MTTYRQVQLVRVSNNAVATNLDLNTTPYKVAAGGWRSDRERLEVGVVIQATTLAELDRYCAAIRRMLAQAEAYASRLHGQPVYIYSKTCDAIGLITPAEIGATWMRKLISAGQLETPDASVRADGHYTMTATLSLQVAEAWERATTTQVLIGYSSTATLARSDGGVQCIGQPLTARRIGWSSVTGMTARFFWLYSDPTAAKQVNFVRLSANFRCWYGAGSDRFTISDEAAKIVQTDAYAFADGEEVEVVVRWTTAAMAIFINGVKAAELTASISWPAPAETYSVFYPDSGVTANLVSLQVYSGALTDGEIELMHDYGRPEPELAFSTEPATTTLTSLYRNIYNVPGETLAPMRVVMSGSQPFDQARVHLRLLAEPATSVKECESGTLGANTATNANADASGGSQARFTPADTAWATRVTVNLAADPDDVDDILGRHRLFLAAYDSAASTNINQIRWRVVIAGVAEAWSEAVSLAAVSTRSLVDLGTLDMPPGAWPDEAGSATSDVVGGSFVTLEIQASNTTGSGGGTLDLDALYLAPAEIECEVTCASFDSADEFVVVDYTSELLNAITVRNWRTMEFATWCELTKDRLELAPRTGLAAFLWAYAYRDSVEKAYPNDTAALFLFYRPMWVR